MRNLRAVRLDVCGEAAGATAACWDAAGDSMIVVFGPTAEEPRVRLARVDGEAMKCHEIASWEATSPRPDMVTDRVVGLHYLSDLATACVVMAGGDIVMAGEDGGGGVQVEIVGSVDAGIVAARWSPDEEVLAVVTGGGESEKESGPDARGSLILMSRAFEPIAETVLTAIDLAASRHVSVGWGKKETQFHGRGAAKALRDPTLPQTVEAGVLSRHDDGTAVTVSWRGDGEYVAVNAVVEPADEANGRARRVVRVFSRSGVLDSVSEPVDGLTQSLSWRPAGNLLAGVRWGHGGWSVVFFERNGLRHGQFDLREPKTEGDGKEDETEGTPSLEWNADSTVLAVVWPQAVQLWTTANYHWYLKQEISLRKAIAVCWHAEKPLQLLAAAADRLVSAVFVFAVVRGTTAPPLDHGAVAVIDGRFVLLTPLRVATVPPPMSLCAVTARWPAVDVALGPGDGVVAVAHGHGLDLWSWWEETNKKQKTAPPEPMATADFPGFTPLQIAVIHDDNSDNLSVCVLGRDSSNSTAVVTFALSARTLVLVSTVAVSAGSTLLTTTAARPNRLHLQDSSGTIVPLGLPHVTAPEPTGAKLPGQLPWAELVEASSSSPLVVGLSRNGSLYAGDRLLARNCTSFLTTPDHLVFTTGSHLLKLVHLDLASSSDLVVPLDDPETDERCRSIERGARLVAVVPSTSAVVLQMPRGNLETVFPRALVVASIRRHIDTLDYARAFAICRAQRVDMNILYDHRPAQLLAHVDRFLAQLPDVAAVDLFLSALRDEDVSQTMYKDTKAVAATGVAATPSASSKVNTICDAVLASLLSSPAGPTAQQLQNVITAHVCKSPPALEDGLRVVAQLLGTTARDPLADRAVEHICFLVDVHRLYDAALGLYDLGLAMAVAQQSQRDPREYVPFLQALHVTEPELRRRFVIDDHLGRHERALAHLQALGDGAFAELLAYVDRHQLYRPALGLYRTKTAERARVTERYAAHLEAQSRFREAALAHESLGDASDHRAAAVRCYRSAGATCWRECLFAAEQLHDRAALVDIATTLAEALEESRDFIAAATVHREYRDAVEAAVRCLCRGHAFAEAMRVAVRHSRTDLLATTVDGGLGDALSSSTELLADCRAQLRAQVPRIVELRCKAAADPLFYYEGDSTTDKTDNNMPDDVSVASSRISTGASLFTRYSTQSGQTRATGQTGQTGQTTRSQQRARKKREDKKRARGRKGTVYELAYLVGSVRRLAERIERARGEVALLAAALVRRDMADRARALEALMAELVAAGQGAIAEVWPPDEQQQQEQQEQQEQLVDKEAAPVIAPFQRLSLLG